MTVKEFLSALQKTPRDWLLIPKKAGCEGIIRRTVRGQYQCPISSLSRHSSVWAAFVARDIGLPDNASRKIISAADNEEDCDPALRRKLLDACGLTDKK